MSAERENAKLRLLGLKAEEVAAILPEGAPRYTAKQVRAFCFDGKSIDEMTSLSVSLREKLKETAVSVPIGIMRVYASRDGSKKYLFMLEDGNLIESVFMPHDYGNTVCVSTQVGCRMHCAFCASGADGLVRDLDFSEILGQVVAVNRAEGGSARKRAVTNIVLMGSGEPLDNYDNVMRFLEEVTAPDGLGVSERNISLSTSGLADKMKKFADSGRKVTLSVSLHSPFDEERSKLMPVNKKYNIASVIDAARYYLKRTGRRVIFEYTLIRGVNDTDACAERLKELTKGFPSHINLIRLNETGSALKRPTSDAAKQFMLKLNALGVSATVRRSFGEDIEGACGQLRRRVAAELAAGDAAEKNTAPEREGRKKFTTA